MKNINYKKGFTLAEMMVALGIMSALLVVVLNAEKGAIKSTTDLESVSDVNNMIQTLTAQLSKPDVCFHNFNGKPVVNPTITELTNISGAKLISAGEKAGRNLTINSISTVAGSTPDQVVLKVNFKPHQKPAQTAAIPLNAYVVGGVINTCYTDLQAMIATAVAYACQGNGARLIAPSGTSYGSCEHDVQMRKDDNSLQNISSGSFLCPDGEFLKQLKSNDGAAITFVCAKMTSTSCGAWEYMSGMDAAGAPICKNIREFFSTAGLMVMRGGGGYTSVNLTCPTNQILKKINGDGTPDCVDPRISQSCPVNTYPNGIDGSGNPICVYGSDTTTCGAGQFIQKVNPDGSIYCSTGIFPSACSSTQVVTGIDSSGNLICGVMP
jgi:prepilin-type N-terminal cleavage/methylation domain-containing protein